MNDKLRQKVIKEKAIGGDAHSQNKLGLMYIRGQGITQDYRQAIVWIAKAANQGDTRSQDCLLALAFHRAL